MDIRLEPPEYLNPDWSPPRYQYVHDWRAYIGEEVREIWHTFSDHQKLVLARAAQVTANGEEWD